MSADVVQRLVERGAEAGAEVHESRGFDWDKLQDHPVPDDDADAQQASASSGSAGQAVYEGEYPGRIALPSFGVRRSPARRRCRRHWPGG